MTTAFDRVPTDVVSAHRKFRLSRSSFTLLAIVFEAVAITAVAVVSGLLWDWMVYGHPANLTNLVPVGIIVSLVYIGTFISRGFYAIERHIVDRRGFDAVFSAWNMAFLILVTLVFLTKSGDAISRGWIVLFYFSGFVSVLATDAAIVEALKRAVMSGFVRRRRVMLVGDDEQLRVFKRNLRPRRTGVDILSCIPIPSKPEGVLNRETALEHADRELTALNEIVRQARQVWADDIVVVSDHMTGADIDRRVQKFLDLPARVHVAAPGKLQHRSKMVVTKVGGATTMSISEPRTAFFHRAPKRLFDIIVSCIALFLLAPVFAAIAFAIRREDDGPVFFRQRRRGFNHSEFRIWKFRTMTTMDDGDHIRQAERNDARVTKVGAFLRKTNLDELPQLINVLLGEMSIVGPRPHAVAHDRDYEHRIDRYARRLNVKPGITGWAQVNGFRGQTKNDHDMRERVAHDLYYIDNWSIPFDIYIMILTVFSPKAFRNAF